MLLCSTALFVARVIGPWLVKPFGLLRHLLTNLCQSDILQSCPGRGPNAIRSIEAARVHHAARWRDGVAAGGVGAAGGVAGDRVPSERYAGCYSPHAGSVSNWTKR